jgi:hypothetical protein
MLYSLGETKHTFNWGLGCWVDVEKFGLVFAPASNIQFGFFPQPVAFFERMQVSVGSRGFVDQLTSGVRRGFAACQTPK